MWADGTSIDVERRRSGRTRWVSDNARLTIGVENPAPAVARDVQRLLLAYGPAGFPPRPLDWMVKPEPGSCAGDTLATGKPVMFTDATSRCGS